MAKDGGETTVYEWDHRNRLVAVKTTDNNGVTVDHIKYHYDVLDRRVGTTVIANGASNAVTERYVLDGEQVALHLDTTGDVFRRNLSELKGTSELKGVN